VPFLRDTVDNLGHIILPHRLQVLGKALDSISKALPPSNKTQIRSFPGLCGVYSRFVPNYASIAKPLTALTKMGSPENVFSTEEELQAFEKLMASLLASPRLSLPRVERPYAIETDASEAQIGCVLQQEDDQGIWRPLGYWSCQLNSAEKTYSGTEKEAIAIVWAVTHWRPCC
jgi:RNase H-like domain found in reverse transcriptase